MIEQRVRDARVGLIHANHITSRGKRLRRRFWFLVFLLLFLFLSLARLLLLFRRQRHRHNGSQSRNLDVLLLQHAQQLQLHGGTLFIGRQHVRRGSFRLRFFYGAFCLRIKILQEHLLVFIEIVERNEQSSFFIIIVVALRPHHFRQRWILLVPSAGILFRLECAFQRV